MSRASEHRARANEFLLQAGIEPNLNVQTILRRLAQGFGHLADLADKAANKPVVVPSAIIGDEKPTKC